MQCKQPAAGSAVQQQLTPRHLLAVEAIVRLLWPSRPGLALGHVCIYIALSLHVAPLPMLLLLVMLLVVLLWLLL
jgi:hypothetical protein